MSELSGNAGEEIERAPEKRRNIRTDGRFLARLRIARRRRYRKLIRDVLKFVAASVAYFAVAYFVMLALLLDFDVCPPGTGTCGAADHFVVGAIVFYPVLSFVYWFRFWRRHWHRKG